MLDYLRTLKWDSTFVLIWREGGLGLCFLWGSGNTKEEGELIHEGEGQLGHFALYGTEYFINKTPE